MKEQKTKIKTSPNKQPSVKLSAIPKSVSKDINKNEGGVTRVISLKTGSYTSSSFAVEKTKRKRKRKIIYWSVVAVLIVLFFTAGPIASWIFGEDSRIAYVLGQSTLDVTNIGSFFADNVEGVIRALSTLFLVFLVVKLCWVVIRLLSINASNRRKTVLALIYSFIKYGGFIVMFFVFLSVVTGTDAGTILAGMGILAIVIGFGLQSLLADIVSGLFIVFENSFEVGDIVTFGNFRGEVVQIGIRTTKLQGVDGNVNVINNSELRNLVNMTQQKSIALCDVTIGYEENLEKIEAMIEANLEYMGSNLQTALEEPRYLGPAEFNASGIVLRFIVKCDEADRMQTTRDMNRQLKLLFDKHKIKFAVPNIKVINGK